MNLLSAVDPKEGKQIQKIFDDNINNAQTDYKAEIEADGNFEQDVKIRAQSGTLDVAMLPQPGALPDLVATGKAVALEDMGYDINQLNTTFGAPFMALGEVDGKHYGIPTNINLKSMIWYPKDDFDKKGYKIPKTWDELMALSDQIVADGGTPWCVGFQSERLHRMACHRLDGRHHASHGGSGDVRQVVQTRDPVQRPGGRQGWADVR